MTEEQKLDNPVWYALSETHRAFAVEYDSILCYHPDYCPFGATDGSAGVAAGIKEYKKLADTFFIVGNKPILSAPLQVAGELVCLQMVCPGKIDLTHGQNIVMLGGQQTDDLFELVSLVQPGYFKKKTALMGDYYGIYQNGQLVAATGERMQMDRYVEVSAVVTHPDFTGRGYAKALVAHTVNNIFAKGKIPCLHVTANNTGAIALYEKLGFYTRREISFWRFE